MARSCPRNNRLFGEQVKVAYFLRYYPTLTETFVYREINELVKRGFEITVFSVGTRPDGDLQDELPSVDLVRPSNYLMIALFLLPSLPSIIGQLIWLLKRFKFKDALKALWLVHKARSFDRIHVHFAGEAAEWALVASRLYKIPFTVTIHAVDLFKPRLSLPEILKEAQDVITISEHNRVLLKNRYGVDAHVVKCGVPKWQDLPPTVTIQPMQVLAIGRWVKKKGFERLIRVIQNTDIRLVLVSDAPDELNKGNISVVGLKPPKELKKLMENTGLVVLPAEQAPDGDMDGIPVVLMEALSAGIPVLTTSISGIPELVDNEVGWIVEPGDDQVLREALLEAAKYPDERAKRGLRGPQRLKERQFGIEDQVEGLTGIWRRY